MLTKIQIKKLADEIAGLWFGSRIFYPSFSSQVKTVMEGGKWLASDKWNDLDDLARLNDLIKTLSRLYIEKPKDNETL